MTSQPAIIYTTESNVVNAVENLKPIDQFDLLIKYRLTTTCKKNVSCPYEAHSLWPGNVSSESERSNSSLEIMEASLANDSKVSYKQGFGFKDLHLNIC